MPDGSLPPRPIRLARRLLTPVRTGHEIRDLARSRGAARASQRALERAGAAGTDVVAGPFLGEVGFELLYWIPFLRRAARRARVAPAQLTAVTRGGAGGWYGDLAARSVDAAAVLGAEYGPALARRAAQAGDAKMLAFEPADRDVLAHPGVPAGPIVHPALMYATMRPFWQGRRDVDWALERLAFAPLPCPPRPPLPDGPYVAVRLYASDALPPDPAAQRRMSDVLAALACELPVVVLVRDDPQRAHPAWTLRAPAGARVVAVDGLDAQSAYAAHAAAFVTTLGGLAYLGPLLGTPTVGVYSRGAFNRRHQDLAERALGARLQACAAGELTAEQVLRSAAAG